MLSKILGIGLKLLVVAPKIVADLESDVSKIKSDKTLGQKITDGFTAFDQLLSEILAAL